MTKSHFADIANHVMAWRGFDHEEFKGKIADALELSYQQGCKDGAEIDQSIMSETAQTLHVSAGFVRRELNVRRSSFLPTPNADESMSLKEAEATLRCIRYSLGKLRRQVMKGTK